jgi:glycosyltransferase involved in cell wall biosynthesis
MINTIKVSVLMSVYNTDFQLVKRALDSVLNQDFQDFEIIVIDDGSNNGSQNHILKFAIEHENKITYLRHSNRSQANSINRGVKFSSGEYITIIDADDEYKPNHLRLCLEEVKNVDLISTKTETIVDKYEDYFVTDKNDPRRVIHVDECVLFATLFGKKEVFADNAFEGDYAADSNFFEDVSKKYNVKKVELRTYIYYRNIPNSVTYLMKKKYDTKQNETTLYAQSNN